jgi:hypothetical protein
MSKYSKSKLKHKKILATIIIVLGVLLIVSGGFLIYTCVKNNITFENIDDAAKFVSDDVASKSTPIVINNVVIGGVYDKTWVSSDKYYMKSTNKKDIDVDVYFKTGKAGKFKLGNLNKQASTLAIFTNTTCTDKSDEYIAVASSDKNMLSTITVQETSFDSDINKVKEALGFLRLFNMSVDINKIYSVKIDDNESGKIVCVTSNSNSFFGVYSAVIYISNTGKTSVIKYNYVRNVKNASDWPVFNLLFNTDLNQDSKNELVIQEISEFNVKYDVIEYKNDKFYEVLSTKVKL